MIDKTNKKYKELVKYSNPSLVDMKSKGYGKLSISTKKDKKYMIETPSGKIVHFGQMGYEDYTKHKDKIRRDNYLKRSSGISGKWRKNKFSPNNLSRSLLW